MDLLARVTVPLVGLLTLLPMVTTGEGLVAGVATALVVGNPYAATTRRWTSTLLQAAVVGLGFGADLRVVLAVGARGVGYTVVGIAGTLAAGALLTSALRVRRDTGVLVTVGTAICGGSAIAAVVPAIDAKEEDATVSLAVVFLLNAAGLLVFPPLGRALHLTPEAFGTWAALAVHDTSSVVGAAAAYDPAAVGIATTLKLARALWIVPLAFGIGAWRRRARGGEAGPGPRPPWFVLGFLAAAAFATFVPAVHAAGPTLARAARQALVLTLFLVGSNLSREAVARVGVRPLVLGVLLWVLVAVGTLLAVRAGLVA